jgi:argininosuccinate lyase
MGKFDSQKRGTAFPAPDFRDTVLAPVFADAQKYFLEPLLEIQYAHTLMLGRQGIMERDEVVQCLNALQSLDLEKIRTAKYDGSFEDLYFYMERELSATCGPENAGKMHTARSRNDIDLTMYRMVLRARLAAVMQQVLDLRKVLTDIAWEHRASLMPAYTHNQPAQPTTIGHYLMAMIECLERDFERLNAALQGVNRCPLGACAITTTGFAIDRAYVARALGFDGLQVNSYGAIAAIDYLTESCSALAVCMVNLGRFAQDMMQWSSAECGYLRLSDGYVQISSIMPQKRNPVPLEHVRILASKALTQSQAVLGCVHNTPFTDMNDGEDNLQPMAYTAFRDAERSLRLLAGTLEEADFLTDRMAACAEANCMTVTELADTLVRTTGMSFRAAHTIVAGAIKGVKSSSDRPEIAARVMHRLQEDYSAFPLPGQEVLLKSLQAENFVAVRKITGGPAAEVLEPEIRRAQALLITDQQRLQQSIDRILQSREYLREEVRSLLAPVESV